MATTSKPSTKTTISSFYQMLTLVQPDDAFLTAQALRVDAGTTTLGQTLLSIYESPSFAQSPADDLTRLFFLAVGRAPDAGSFNAVMPMFRTGTTMQYVADHILSLPGLPLSTDGLSTSLSFAQTLIMRIQGRPDELLEATIAADLDAGSYSRGALLAHVAGITNMPMVPESNVETALLYLAGAGREANPIELRYAGATTADRVIEALDAAGLSATGGSTALTLTGDVLTLNSELASDLVWDLSKGVFKLGGSTSFKVFYSLDKGLSGSVVSFSAKLVDGAMALDAQDATGKGKITFTGSSTESNVFLAPDAGSTATGGTKSDIFVGGIGVDTFTATGGQDFMTGGLGDDKFILAASPTYTTGSALTTITDFGEGKDTLDFTKLLNKSVDVSKLTAVLADSTAGVALANGSVSLLANNGVWVSGASTEQTPRAATASDVAALFGAGAPFAAPTAVGKFAVITADTVNSADVWLVLNSSDVTAITDGVSGPSEVFQVAHLVGSWNATLVGLLPTVL